MMLNAAQNTAACVSSFIIYVINLIASQIRVFQVFDKCYYQIFPSLCELLILTGEFRLSLNLTHHKLISVPCFYSLATALLDIRTKVNHPLTASIASDE